MTADQPFTATDLAAAERLLGLTFTEPERDLMLEDVIDNRKQYEALRTVPVPNDVPPALWFDPRLPAMRFPTEHRPLHPSRVPPPPAPANLDDLAFWPLTHLAALIASKQITSSALTEMYLARLKRFDPALKCVVTLTEELARAQAKRADEEIARGQYRGPLHGIPYGLKDLLSARGVRTTWGAEPYVEQIFDYDSTVAEKLEAAGAVLAAKTSVGALAWGDVWFGGMTRNPWNIEEGSSGSSAGSASAVAAGLVGFAIGTETYGSIVSPCTRCGVTGLRPTFGRVSRHGAMALSWSMDKIGPLARTVEDCALVFAAIHGADPKDPSAVQMPFNWDAARKVADLRVGYVKSAFDEERENKAQDAAALEALRSLGVNLVPIALPDLPINALQIILLAESAAAFDDLTRSGRDDLLARQVRDAWPNSFRTARFVPAVEYVQANRVRTLAMRQMAKLMEEIDVYVAPAFAGTNLLLTNLTGHPCVVAPNGRTEKGGHSTITFTGRLYGEEEALLLAKAYQDATDFHLKHPLLP